MSGETNGIDRFYLIQEGEIINKDTEYNIIELSIFQVQPYKLNFSVIITFDDLPFLRFTDIHMSEHYFINLLAIVVVM